MKFISFGPQTCYMTFNYTLLASARTDDELMERIDNRQKYMPETVEASLAELQHRGKEFSDEEIRYIKEDMQARRRNAALINGALGIFNGDVLKACYLFVYRLNRSIIRLYINGN